LLFGLFNIFLQQRNGQSLNASPSKRESSTNQILATPLFHVPVSKQAESMVARSNGQLLVTVDTGSELYQINPFHNQVGRVVHRFDGYTSSFGITEDSVDDFLIIASNFSKHQTITATKAMSAFSNFICASSGTTAAPLKALPKYSKSLMFRKRS